MARATLVLRAQFDPAFVAAIAKATSAVAELSEILKRDDLVAFETETKADE